MTFESPYTRMLIENDILYVYYKKGLTINLPMAVKIVQDRIKFTNSKEYFMIVIDEGVVSLSKDARDYFSGPEGTCYLTAIAFIQRNLFSRMLINFFIRLANLKVKTQVFEDIDAAKKWYAGMLV